MDLNEMLVFARVVQAAASRRRSGVAHASRPSAARFELEERLRRGCCSAHAQVEPHGRRPTYYDYCGDVGEIETRGAVPFERGPTRLLAVTLHQRLFLGPIVSDYFSVTGGAARALLHDA